MYSRCEGKKSLEKKQGENKSRTKDDVCEKCCKGPALTNLGGADLPGWVSRRLRLGRLGRVRDN
jgi:hypothetical protein